MVERKHLLHYRRKNREKRKRIKSSIFLTEIIWILAVTCPVVYAGEFGGFDISTGAGEFEGAWSGWDDAPSYNAPEQESGENHSEEVRNNGQETERSEPDFIQDSKEYNENTPVRQYEDQEGASVNNPENDFYYIQSESGQHRENTSQTENSDIQESVETAEKMEMTEISPTMPAETPTPAPTLTVTPTPVFTEVPTEEETSVTEYNEEYRLPPAECLRKMQLFYWKKELAGGEIAEIQLNSKIIQKIISVRLNGQEMNYKVNDGKLQVTGLSEGKNLFELAVMIPADLTWTEEKKNVILAYNIF